MTARVSLVSSHSVRAEWTISVRREPVGYLGDPEVSSPLVDDVPADIRAALNAWLNPPATAAEDCWSFRPVSSPENMALPGMDRVCSQCGAPYRDHV